MKKLKEQRGDFSIKGAFILLIVSILLVLSVSVLGVVSRVSVLHSMADSLVRYVSIRGVVDSAVDAEINRLEASSGLDCGVVIDGDYITGTKKIQYGDQITVTVKYTERFGVGGIVSVPIELQSRSEGRSEQYWK